MKMAFDLHENETACRTHFHIKGFALNSFEKEAQENSEMANCACVLYVGQQGIESSFLSRFCLNIP